MKPIVKQSSRKAAFTIVELLTVMSIIIILIGLLVPSLNMVKRYAKKVRQKAQFHSIDVAMELFQTEWEGYPNSGALDGSTLAGGVPYCGAMKLCEAMVGQDLLGFHPSSLFRSDGTDGAGTVLYNLTDLPTSQTYIDNLRARRGPYLQLDNANAYTLKDIYGSPPGFNSACFVLCDVYSRVTNLTTGKKIGMPILYYKANTSNTLHDVTTPTNPLNIYNYLDNDNLVKLPIPWDTAGTLDHPLDLTPALFYSSTQNTNITTTSRPYRADSYILLSAGFDGLYGTSDDIFNFGVD